MREKISLQSWRNRRQKGMWCFPFSCSLSCTFHLIPRVSTPNFLWIKGRQTSYFFLSWWCTECSFNIHLACLERNCICLPFIPGRKKSVPSPSSLTHSLCPFLVHFVRRPSPPEVCVYTAVFLFSLTFLSFPSFSGGVFSRTRLVCSPLILFLHRTSFPLTRGVQSPSSLQFICSSCQEEPSVSCSLFLSLSLSFILLWVSFMMMPSPMIGIPAADGVWFLSF